MFMLIFLKQYKNKCLYNGLAIIDSLENSNYNYKKK